MKKLNFRKILEKMFFRYDFQGLSAKYVLLHFYCFHPSTYTIKSLMRWSNHQCIQKIKLDETVYTSDTRFIHSVLVTFFNICFCLKYTYYNSRWDEEIVNQAILWNPGEYGTWYTWINADGLNHKMSEFPWTF